LKNLKQILETGWTYLEKGGRMCVVSFHSLEDRLVKETFRELARKGVMQVVTRKPITPSQEELERNPRSRSAKLRCAERL
jgi:16S rRNA (cytosine1402-N4)-methyltransferase